MATDRTTTTTQSATKTPQLIAQLRGALNNPDLQLSHRYRALFGLKHHACLSPPNENTIPAIEAIASAFEDPSALLKHEVAYCLGQTRNNTTLPYLRAVLEDKSEEAMVRHEAAEALGALGDQSCIDLLIQKRDNPEEPDVVRETCEIAVERIQWEHSSTKTTERLKQRLARCTGVCTTG
jgi:deoxyhypusine monooxygenase